MKANEFVKKFGWFTSKEYMAGATIFDNNLMFFTNRNELNQLIEAKELVDSFGGLDGAKKYLRTRDVWVTAASNSRLICAIQLVESCQ